MTLAYLSQMLISLNHEGMICAIPENPEQYLNGIRCYYISLSLLASVLEFRTKRRAKVLGSRNQFQKRVDLPG